MFDKLEIMRIAHGLASHSSARQSTIARNIANADTPDYRARDMASFADTFRGEAMDTTVRATRPGHLGLSEQGYRPPAAEEVNAPLSPNGNSVSIESEMVKSIEVKRDHDLALSVYRSSLNILRASIGRA